mmetsp:Transcript_6330/g.25302  ORF Transcript_6330/g.25302 Transcript_6330/m.25302 type:complete len:95 (+) Transcript_6330:525-809(+)
MGSTTFRFTSLLNLMRYLSSVFLGWSTVGKASLDLHPPCSERGMLVHSRLPLNKVYLAQLSSSQLSQILGAPAAVTKSRVQLKAETNFVSAFQF